MKKSWILILLAITLASIAFIAGFYTGRITNQAAIRVETPSPTAPSAGSSGTEGTYSGQRVNINTATVQELMTLPGIGEVIAQRIVDYRTANGPFQSVSQLLNVSGIGQKTLEELWNYITVGG